MDRDGRRCNLRKPWSSAKGAVQGRPTGRLGSFLFPPRKARRDGAAPVYARAWRCMNTGGSGQGTVSNRREWTEMQERSAVLASFWSVPASTENGPVTAARWLSTMALVPAVMGGGETFAAVTLASVVSAGALVCTAVHVTGRPIGRWRALLASGLIIVSGTVTGSGATPFVVAGVGALSLLWVGSARQLWRWPGNQALLNQLFWFCGLAVAAGLSEGRLAALLVALRLLSQGVLGAVDLWRRRVGGHAVDGWLLLDAVLGAVILWGAL